MSFEQDSFDRPPGTGSEGGLRRPAGQRLSGSPQHPRHRGLTHHPHTHSLAQHAGLHHPHLSAAAGTAAHATAHAGGHTQTQQAPGTPVDHQHRSRTQLPARMGVQRIEVGIIQSYSAGPNTALVRLLGAQTNLIGPLPISQAIAPGLALTGAACLVALLDEANPADGAVIAVFGAPAPLWQQAGSASLLLTGASLAQSVTFPVAFANGVAGCVATSRHPDYVASVSGESAGGFLLTLTRREGATQFQAGAATCTVAAGATSGATTVTFPVAFAVARTAVVSSTNPSWLATVSVPSATGCTLTLAGMGGAVGPITVTAYWQASGDPAVSVTVAVDWLAVGS